MKTIIIILTLLLSVSIFSAEAQHEAKTDFEAGVMFGYITSSGFFLKYNIDNDISLRASGYIAKLNKDLVYDTKLSLTKTIHNSKYGEFYLIASTGIFIADSNEGIISDDSSVNLYFISAGLGYKYKFTKGTNMFFEMEQNAMFLNNTEEFLLIPIPTFGISVDF